ncbi:hypothetical protein [Urechidicola croceus]|uniref:Uncharacterized protein n=1 Tax=Urechidicola croceus TaxID=1850246 RepID=A0A1D8P4G9_9FLAO|nr:hypothetical protein [Urechidicola croceus]AOW19472.1 hypothetical protein LPB138_01675 [Urechidicola croceus]
MKKLLLFTFLLISQIQIFACSCAPTIISTAQKEELENSECIFIGEVVKVSEDRNTFEIRVIESLDGGDEINNIYIGKNWKYCSPYISTTGKWIVYGNIEEGFLRLNMCGISRSFEHPEWVSGIIQDSTPQINYRKYKSSEIKTLEIERKKDSKKKAKIELEKEIVALRKRRDK